jgi:ADP-ribose pyrophosphatase YjhB (NUDIX family)
MKRRLHRFALGLYRRIPRKGRRWIVRGLSPKYTVGAMCLIERDGSFLLVRHAYRSRWGVPGGLEKRGEHPEDAVHREVWEEVRLRVELDGEPAVVVEAEPQRVDVVYRARMADPLAEPVSTSPEIVATEWFPIDRLPELQHELTAALMAVARASRSFAASPLRAVDTIAPPLERLG